MLRRSLLIMFLLFAFLALIVPTFAQDATPEPTATPLAVIIDYPADLTIPVPTTVPTVTPAPIVVEQPSGTSLLLDKLFNVLLLGAVVFLAFKQSALIPPDVLDSVMVKLFEYGKQVTTQIPGDADDRLLSITEEVIRRWIKEEQAKQNPPPSVN